MQGPILLGLKSTIFAFHKSSTKRIIQLSQFSYFDIFKDKSVSEDVKFDWLKQIGFATGQLGYIDNKAVLLT